MEISFLFGPRCEWLGEVITTQGKMVQFVLTPAGERDIGIYVEEWQTRGIPVKREVAIQQTKGEEIVFYIDRIQIRDGHFLLAVQRWMEAHGYAVLSITPLMNDVWPVIQHLPLEPREQFTFLVLLRGVSRAEGQAWKEVLHEAEKAVDQEGRISPAGLSRLRAHSSDGFAKALEKKKTKT